MIAIGKVININGDTALVSSQRSSACSACRNCESHGTCHAELIFGNQSEEVTVCAKNDVDARVGDIVELQSSTLKTLFTSFALFVVPLILTCILYLLLQAFLILRHMPIILIVSYFVFFVTCAFVMNVFIKRHTSVSIVRIIEECKQGFERK